MKRSFTIILLIAFALVANMSLVSADDMWWADAAAPYAGTTIRGVSESTPPSNYVADVLAAQFTELTGINVEFETTSWDQMYSKAINDMEANTGIYDFVYIEQDIIYSYLAQDYLVNLTQFAADNMDLASADYDEMRFHQLRRLLQERRWRSLRRAHGSLRQGLPVSQRPLRRCRHHGGFRG